MRQVSQGCCSGKQFIREAAQQVNAAATSQMYTPTDVSAMMELQHQELIASVGNIMLDLKFMV